VPVRRSLGAVLVLLFAVHPAFAGDDRSDALRGAVSFGVPRPVEVSARELVVEVPVHVRSIGVSATVERVDFDDMALNGIPFEVESYTTSFELPESGSRELEDPLRLRLDFRKVAPGLAWESLFPSDTLRLTGRVAVEGTFRKWIFSVRRSVEVPIDLSHPNPLAEYHPGRLVTEELRTRGLW
jgi:hypothetical protein